MVVRVLGNLLSGSWADGGKRIKIVNPAVHLSKSEWAETFKMFDKDGSGSISKDEFQSVLSAMGISVCPKKVEEMITSVDTDGDHTLDFEEFHNAMEAIETSVLSYEEAQKFFDTFDMDGSGYITTAELRHSLTAVGASLDDETMDEIMKHFDADGSGQITLDEFVDVVLPELGFTVIKPNPDDVSKVSKPDIAEPVKKEVKVELPVKMSDPQITAILKSLADPSGKILASELRLAVDIALQNRKIGSKDAETDPALHWTQGREKRGLGKVIHKANHLALTVEDVGKSAAFYSDIIGLQQIRRPDFDRHGAWFTMGNLELHLIKGIPIAPPEDHLVVSHLSIETYNIDAVPGILTELGVPFRQNISVPKGKRQAGSGTNDSNQNDVAIKQYFIRDPDGYYVEVCNCDVLTKYCLGEKSELAGYGEGIAPLSFEESVMVSKIGLKIARIGRNWSFSKEKNAEKFAHLVGASIDEIAEVLGCKPADEVDQDKLKNLRTRRTVWTDVCQNETNESLELVLKAAGNNMAQAIEIIEIKNGAEHKYIPPAFYVQGVEKLQPKSVVISKK